MTYCEKYGYTPSEAQTAKALAQISENAKLYNNETVLKTCFSLMDLTSLHNEDTPSSITKFTSKVNEFAKQYPNYPLPASICVYSNFAGTVVSVRENKDVHATVVSACFPTSQSFLEVKLLECKMAVQAGADEVDIVLAHNAFDNGDLEAAANEIRQVRSVIDAAASGRKIVLKVILETGLIKTQELIAEASFLAMEAGADFIKTSTGKVSVNATPEAAYVMCKCIEAYTAKTGRMVGFKPAGGLSSADDALLYYTIVHDVLSDKWLNKSFFRFGVSRMANNLISAIEGTQVNFF